MGMYGTAMQCANRPRLQRSQRPQAMCHGTTTRSPDCTCGTSSPVSTTSATHSCPIANGGGTGDLPAMIIVSTSQVVAATGRTIASVASCSLGSGASRHATARSSVVADAVRFAGRGASTAMRHSLKRGDSPAKLFAMVCGFYRRALVDSDFAAACPVGAVAQEAHADPILREAVDEVFSDWRAILIEALMAHGRSRKDSRELAELCLTALEGALIVARVAQEAGPVDGVERQLIKLLAAD